MTAAAQNTGDARGRHPLSAVSAALADPSRRAILARLPQGEASVGALAAPLAMSGPAISEHLRVLERAGLITRGREAQWRPARLEATPLREVAAYADGFRRFWDESFTRLDDHLAQMEVCEVDLRVGGTYRYRWGIASRSSSCRLLG